MSRMVPLRAARSDDSRAEIVKALRAAGASVEDLGYPVDLLVGYQGRDFLIDCKTDKAYAKKDGYVHREKGRITPAQERFVKAHKGSKVHFVRNPKEAVALVVFGKEPESGAAP